MILPSLLEYLENNLDERLSSVKSTINTNDWNNLVLVDEIKKIKTLHLHLDFVCERFAKDRSNTLKSLSFEIVFNLLLNNFSEMSVSFSVHLMGESEDLIHAWKFFYNFKIPKNWEITLFLPKKHYLAWETQFTHYKIGFWLDLYEWQNETENIDEIKKIRNILLMTVTAGKSGQKLTPETIQNLKKFISKIDKKNKNIIVDGGWNKDKAKDFLENNNFKSKIDFVSYSGFWSATI